MKKIVGIIALMCLAIASSLPTSAQVDYTVYFSWDDSYCSCNEPVTVYAMVIIRTYPEGDLVDMTPWYEISSSPTQIDDAAISLQDCDEPCYNVAVVIKVEDNTGQCCYGSDNANTTGQNLKNGYTLPYTVVLY